jgi:hypothetical protein
MSREPDPRLLEEVGDLLILAPFINVVNNINKWR